MPRRKRETPQEEAKTAWLLTVFVVLVVFGLMALIGGTMRRQEQAARERVQAFEQMTDEQKAIHYPRASPSRATPKCGARSKLCGQSCIPVAHTCHK